MISYLVNAFKPTHSLAQQTTKAFQSPEFSFRGQVKVFLHICNSEISFFP